MPSSSYCVPSQLPLERPLEPHSTADAPRPGGAPGGRVKLVEVGYPQACPRRCRRAAMPRVPGSGTTRYACPRDTSHMCVRGRDEIPQPIVPSPHRFRPKWTAATRSRAGLRRRPWTDDPYGPYLLTNERGRDDLADAGTRPSCDSPHPKVGDPPQGAKNAKESRSWRHTSTSSSPSSRG